MKIDISNKVPFSNLKPGDRGTIDGKPFVRIGALVDPTVSCGGVVQAVSLDDGRPLSISGDTLVEADGSPFLDEAEQAQPGDVWEDDSGLYWLRTNNADFPWASLSNGGLLTFEAQDVRRVDVKLVRA